MKLNDKKYEEINATIVAPFMGLQKTMHTYRINEQCQFIENKKGVFEKLHDFLDEDLQYHSDWRWLMGVVEKIEAKLDLIYKDRNLNDQSNVKWLHCEEILERYEITVQIQIYHRRNQLSLMVGLTRENVYRFAVRFIEWYNQQNK